MVVYGMVLYRSHHHPTAETLPPRQIDLLALMIANGQQDLWMLQAFVGAMSALLRQRC